MPPTPGAPYQAHLLDPGDPDAAALWEALRTASSDVSPFDALAYARAAADAFGLGLRLAVATRRDEPRAGTLLYTRRRWGISEIVVPPLTPYTPVLAGRGWHPGEIHRQGSSLDALLDRIERDFPAAALHLQPGLTDTRPFDWRGWRVRPLFTYHVPLPPGEPPHARWSKGNRRDFLKGRDASVLHESPEAIPVVLALSRDSYARHGRSYPAPLDRVRLLVDRLREAGLVRAFTLTLAGRDEPEAGLLLLRERGRACYWIAGGAPGPASTLLVGHVLHRLHDEGVSGMDFVGANTRAIAEFKRRFGSVLAPYHRAERRRGLRPWLLDRASAARQTARAWR